MARSESKVINVLISEGTILRLELRADTAGKGVYENEKNETSSVSVVDPGHIGREGEWW